MPKKLLSLERIRNLDYATLHDGLYLIPSDETDPDTRDQFKLKDLHYAPLNNDPDFPKFVTAQVLVRVYKAAGYHIKDPRDLFLKPGEKTLLDLANFIKKHHLPRFDDEVSPHV